jgi:hypothetical protein
MPTEDAIKFLYKDFCNKTKKIVQNANQHPDSIQTLLKTLIDGRSLTVLQYEHIIQYLAKKKEIQRKNELGEYADNIDYDPDTVTSNAFAPTASAASIQSMTKPSVADSQGELQRKIMDILNKKTFPKEVPKPLTQSEKDELKKKLLQDDKIKQAMVTLRQRLAK